jgi:general secretion pathway protein C
VILLAASLAYWGSCSCTSRRSADRRAAGAACRIRSHRGRRHLFGGQITVAAATNYQLTGIVAATARQRRHHRGRRPAAEGAGVGRELVPGVTLRKCIRAT